PSSFWHQSHVDGGGAIELCSEVKHLVIILNLEAADEVLLARMNLGPVVDQVGAVGGFYDVGLVRHLALWHEPHTEIGLAPVVVANHRTAAFELALDELMANLIRVHAGQV